MFPATGCSAASEGGSCVCRALLLLTLTCVCVCLFVSALPEYPALNHSLQETLAVTGGSTATPEQGSGGGSHSGGGTIPGRQVKLQLIQWRCSGALWLVARRYVLLHACNTTQ